MSSKQEKDNLLIELESIKELLSEDSPTLDADLIDIPILQDVLESDSNHNCPDQAQPPQILINEFEAEMHKHLSQITQEVMTEHLEQIEKEIKTRIDKVAEAQMKLLAEKHAPKNQIDQDISDNDEWNLDLDLE